MNDIYSSDSSLNVINSVGYSGPYTGIVLDDMRAMDGDVRFNCNQLEVYSSGCWYQIQGNGSDISLHQEDKDALAWAKKKMAEEQQEQELLEKHPALKSAKDKYNTIKAIVENG